MNSESHQALVNNGNLKSGCVSLSLSCHDFMLKCRTSNASVAHFRTEVLWVAGHVNFKQEDTAILKQIDYGLSKELNIYIYIDIWFIQRSSSIDSRMAVSPASCAAAYAAPQG